MWVQIEDNAWRMGVSKQRLTKEEFKTVIKMSFLKPLPIPRVEGGNVVVEIDEDDNHKGVNELMFSVVGKLSLQNGEVAPSTLDLK